MKRKLVALLCTLCMTTSLFAGCGSSSTSGSETAEETAEAEDTEEAEEDYSSAGVVDETRETGVRESINIAIEDPIELLPFRMTGGSEGKRLLYQVYETLCVLNGTGGEMTGTLAKDWTINDDNTLVTVELYDYITDSEGNTIDAYDVEWCYNYAIENSYLTNVSTLDTIVATGDYTVEFSFPDGIQNAGELEDVLCRLFIVDQDAFEASDDGFVTSGIGTGPYVIDEFTSGSSVRLVINDNYWQTDDSLKSYLAAANVETINYYVISDSAQLVTAITTGQVDLAEGIVSTSIDQFKTDDNYGIYILPDTQSTVLLPNCDEVSICSDENFRAAIFYAINNDLVVSTLGEDAALPLNEVMNSVFGDYQEEWDTEENYNTVYDLELAKEYLEKSSYNGETIRFYYMQSTSVGTAAEVIGMLLDELGVSYELISGDASTFFTNRSDTSYWDFIFPSGGSNNYGVGIWSLIFNANNYGGNSFNFIVDEELQSLFEACYSLEGHEDVSNLNAFHEYFMEHYYAMGIYQSKKNIIYNSNAIATIVVNDKEYTVPGAFTYYVD